jgi:V/A-type H+/Na+-transporting ATPase subunit I
MIVQMKKVSMVVQTKDKETTLDSLRELGLVHLEDFQCSSPEVEAVSTKQSKVSTAYNFLAEFKPKEELPAPVSDPDQATEDTLKLSEDLQALKDKAASIDKEIASLQKWGDFDPADFKFLADKGYFVKIYYASGEQVKDVAGLEGDVVILWQEKNALAFAHTTRDLVTLEAFEEFALPAESLGAMHEKKKDLLEKIAELKETAYRYYAFRPMLKQYMADLEEELEYLVAKANVLEEEGLTAIVGYVPEDQAEPLEAWARENSIAVSITDPGEDDSIPTLVRNPKWLEVIRPVFQFLGTVPGYQELDISIFFLSFFLIFFAMIIGDAAYGAIFFLGGLAGVLLSMGKKARPPLAAWLFTCLGMATIVWGAITGSWFGSPELIRGTFLERLVIRQLTEGFSIYTPAGQFYTDLSGQDVIKLLCFIIALIHLTIAQVWNFLQEVANRSLRAVAQFAWICINFGLFYLVLSMVMYFDLDQALGTGDFIGRLSLILILGGLGLVVLFGSQEGNFVKGVLAGLAGLLPTALGTVSAFGDIISYIRLFAVGLAGAEIAKSFNTMASGLLEGNTFIIGVLVLVLGHALNFILCSLGVLVHGIRLNMLEFSGRLGMEWSGQEYSPFKARQGEAYSVSPPGMRTRKPAVGCATENVSCTKI